MHIATKTKTNSLHHQFMRTMTYRAYHKNETHQKQINKGRTSTCCGLETTAMEAVKEEEREFQVL